MKALKSLLYIAICVQTFGAMMLPMKFDKRIDGTNGGYQEYQIANSTDETVRYKIYKKSEPKDLEDKRITGDMSRWIQYYPKIITIPPKSTGIVKVAIKSPLGAKEGEYVARLGTSPLEVPKLGESKNVVSPQINLPIGMEMKIFGYVGDIAPKLESDIKSFKNSNGTYFKGKIKNIGTAGMKILASYRYKDSTGTHSTMIPLGRIYPDGEISIDTSTIEKSINHKGLEIEIKEDGGNKVFLKITE